MQTSSHLTSPAINPHETWWAGLQTADARSVHAMLATEIAGGRHQRSVYELFAEMEEKDGHLYSVIQTRINGLLGLPRTIQPAASTPAANQLSTFVARVVENIPRLDELLRALLDSLSKGFSVVELLWGYDSSGHLVPVDWSSHPQEFFLFDPRGRLLLISPPFNPPAAGAVAGPPQPSAARTLLPCASALRPPARKFITSTFGRDARNPYGRGLCHRAYWYYWFKKTCLKAWAVFNERYGSPTAIASYPPGTPEDERSRLLEALQSLQGEAGIVVPETIQLRLLEAAKSGDGETYQSMAAYCNDEISKIVLGATLTTNEGRRSGSLALGNVHNAVRQDYIEADARLLADCLNNTLIRWIVELNFPSNQYPRLVIDTTPPEDLEQQVRIDHELIGLGVPIPLSHFYTRYGRPSPADGERALKYDDANLFQYHLRYGVLTINEVRARLHLPPVPWGNTPAGEAAPSALSQDTGPGREKNIERKTETEPRED